MLSACGGPEGQQVVISTNLGDITVLLYDDTPGHRDNFVKLVKEDFFEDLLFHRVMKGFMIQGGDPNSRNAAAGARLGSGGPGYTIPHEIGLPHYRGMLAAARQPDSVNPQKASSGSQFYIIHGNPVTDQMLDMFGRNKGIQYSPEQRALYKEIGGRPDLDMDYTVFGEVLDGMDVVDQIAGVSVDPANRPFEDVSMKVRLK